MNHVLIFSFASLAKAGKSAEGRAATPNPNIIFVRVALVNPRGNKSSSIENGGTNKQQATTDSEDEGLVETLGKSTQAKARRKNKDEKERQKGLQQLRTKMLMRERLQEAQVSCKNLFFDRFLN